MRSSLSQEDCEYSLSVRDSRDEVCRVVSRYFRSNLSHEGFCVSTSHEGSLVAVCQARGLRVGVDLAVLNKETCELAEQVKDEFVHKMDSVPGDPMPLFCLWTAKEAFAKLLGLGYGSSACCPNDIIVTLNTRPTTGVVFTSGDKATTPDLSVNFALEGEARLDLTRLTRGSNHDDSDQPACLGNPFPCTVVGLTIGGQECVVSVASQIKAPQDIRISMMDPEGFPFGISS